MKRMWQVRAEETAAASHLCSRRGRDKCAHRAAARSIVAAPSAEPLTRLSQRHRPPATIWWPCTRLKIFGECTTVAARAPGIKTSPKSSLIAAASL